MAERVYFIMGCTASGKGALGRELAGRVGGRIVSVDSMKIYRRMDIGTGKPSAALRAQTPHHCIDIAEPSESFSVARYVTCADSAIDEIRSAGSIPLALDEAYRLGRVRPGSRVLLCGFGAGLTWGTALLQW